MNENTERFLPIGSVVILKGGTKRVMVTGYLVKSDSSGDKIWDYVGCLYPEGMISQNKNLLFNHADIDKVFALGYSDDEQKKFMEAVKKAEAARLENENQTGSTTTTDTL